MLYIVFFFLIIRYFSPVVFSGYRSVMKVYLTNKMLGMTSMSIHSGSLDMETGLFEEEGLEHGTKKSSCSEDKTDMILAFQDPERLKLFRQTAENCAENIDFISAIFDYTIKAEDALVRSTSIVGDEMKDKAMAIYAKHVQVNSADEVNVSFATRGLVEMQLKAWTPAVLLSKGVAQSSLSTDKFKRVAVFAPAFKEISDVIPKFMEKV